MFVFEYLTQIIFLLSQTPLTMPKPKDDIPVPEIKTVESYKTDLPPDYHAPLAYVRHHKPSHQELRDSLEYVIDAEDEAWLHNNAKFGGSVPKSGEKGTKEEKAAEESKKKTMDSPQTIPLPLSYFEIMMDIMEKATGFEIIITLDQAEHLILNKLPQLLHMYPRKGKAQVVTLRHVLYDVYQYWVSKRSKLKRPLLRRFWPVTSTEDTNPHLVFRPREKEKYKLRKKRQNDMDAYRKMQQLKQDFAHVRLLLSLVKQREELYRSLVLMQKEWFEQKLYDALDTSGLCRVSQDLDRKSLNELMQVQKHFEVQEGGPGSWRRNKRGRRGNPQAGSSRSASRSTTPVPTDSAGDMFGSTMGDSSLLRGAAAGLGAETIKVPVVVAGHDNGEPAPNFLQPLPTRESYATTWEGSVPHVTTIVDGRPMPTFRFRHRPRVGRGGRICVDRVPLETDPNVAPNTYYRAAAAPSQALEPKERLLDLLPPQINKDSLSRRIEEICLTALKEDYDAQANGSASADPEENDGTEVVVPVQDWLDTDDQLWGEERYAVGPL
jgi:enhancer of polycomb-like protein